MIAKYSKVEMPNIGNKIYYYHHQSCLEQTNIGVMIVTSINTFEYMPDGKGVFVFYDDDGVSEMIDNKENEDLIDMLDYTTVFYQDGYTIHGINAVGENVHINGHEDILTWDVSKNDFIYNGESIYNKKDGCRSFNTKPLKDQLIFKKIEDDLKPSPSLEDNYLGDLPF